MKISRFIKLIFLGMLLAYFFQNPPDIEYSKQWISGKVEQVASLLEAPPKMTPKDRDSPASSNDNSHLPDSSSASTTSHDASSSTAVSDSTSSSAAVWPKKTARVYIDLPENISASYRSAWEEALDNWNKAGVFKLVTITNKDQADIVLTTENKSNTPQAGVAETKMLINPLTGKKVITHAVAKLNTYYLDDYSTERKVNTAEHELGHTMGLEHTTAHPSVMQPQGSNYGIQQYDVEQLKQLYH